MMDAHCWRTRCLSCSRGSPSIEENQKKKDPEHLFYITIFGQLRSVYNHN
jgi:hypothetical protein